MFENIDITNNKPSPFDFSSPGEYLISAYQYFKEKEPGLSHRYLSASMGYKSPAAFQDIIKGRVVPKEEAIKALRKIFCLTKEELDFLVLLFIMQNIRNPFFREIIFARLIVFSLKTRTSENMHV